MQHVTLDGIKGFRSRLDDVQMVQEVLDKTPLRLGLRPAMPAFLLPYYNGVAADDCGISAFVFLNGGHFTLHTFSFREAYFADLVSIERFSGRELKAAIESSFPCESTSCSTVARTKSPPTRGRDPNQLSDFGPHVFMHIQDYTGPTTLDDLFELFDLLPEEISMTPIMRPYVLKSRLKTGKPCLSAITMIAESHLSIHVLPDSGEAFFDLFSCQFFEIDRVMTQIRKRLPGKVNAQSYIGRGPGYKQLRTLRESSVLQARTWIQQSTFPFPRRFL